MGLDIYCGSYTRYFAQEWKTITQHILEEQGINYRLEGRPSQDELASPEEIQESVGEWKAQIKIWLESNGVEGLEDWEDNLTSRYYTNKPDWEAFGALLYMVSAKVQGAEIPETQPKTFDYFNSDIMQSIPEDSLAQWSLYQGVCHYLPYKVPLSFSNILANGANADMSTLGSLEAEVNLINNILWQAPLEEILKWEEAEGYPADYVLQDGKMVQGEIHEEYNVESLAKYAYVLLLKATMYSMQNHLPLIFDY